MVASARSTKVAKASNRGAKPGERRGGRSKGTPNKATAEIRDLAREYTDKALKALVNVLEESESDPARVSAANAILDRGWGKPSQTVKHGGIGGGAIKHLVQVSDEDLLAIATGAQ